MSDRYKTEIDGLNQTVYGARTSVPGGIKWR